MQLNYRSYLSNIKESPAGKSISYNNFACKNKSLKKTMLAMASPKPHLWSVKSEFKEKDFLESCQGVANDNKYWYFTSNGNKGRQGIFKYTASMKRVKSLKFTGNEKLLNIKDIPTKIISINNQKIEYPRFGHVGDPECYNDIIYVPIQNPHGFLTINTSLEASTVKWFPTQKMGDSHPWCAINPLNEKLYTSKFINEDLNKSEYKLTLYAYDSESIEREPEHDIELKIPTLRVQGGSFSPNGTLFLSSDAKYIARHLKKLIGFNSTMNIVQNLFEQFLPENLVDKIPKGKYSENIKNVIASGIPIHPCITCYSPINGHLFGTIKIMRESGLTYDQEVEGLTYWKRNVKGQNAQLHVVLLENEPGTDEVFFKHYSSNT